jgi:AraC-like DNA-binding protein
MLIGVAPRLSLHALNVAGRSRESPRELPAGRRISESANSSVVATQLIIVGIGRGERIAKKRRKIDNLRQNRNGGARMDQRVKQVGLPAVPGRRAVGAMVRVGPLTRIPQVLRDLGCEPAAVFGDSPFVAAYFDDPDLPIPYVAGSELIARCVTATGCEHFGLLVGQQSDAFSLGLAGFLLMSAPDVGSALRDLVRYLDLHDGGGVPTLETRGGTTLLGFSIVEPGTEATDQVYDLSMAVACNLMRALCGRDWNPAEVLLPRQRPTATTPWAGFFRAPVRFGAGQCALAFPASCLARPVPAANPQLHRHLEQEAERRRGEWGPDFVSQVQRTVSGTMAGGRCAAVHIARLLGMHTRTLNRRLLAEGRTFKQVQDEVRYAMSRQLLGNTSMKLAEVAASLGYADASAFIRAFSRWAGTTPDAWRRANGPARRSARGSR